MDKKVYLSLVLPAFNEERNLKRGVLASVYEYLSGVNYSWEVLIVDDGSTDNTVTMVTSFIKSHPGFKLYKEPHRGKGGTVIAGMLKAEGEIVLFSDMDQSTPIDQVEKFFPEFESGSDIVIGSRNGRPGQTTIRKIMAWGWVVLRTLILRLPFSDTQCGFKAFKKDAAKEVFEKMQIFTQQNSVRGAAVTAGFDLELLYVAKKLKLKISEVSVDWYEYGDRKEVSPLKDSWEGLRDLMRIRINSILGKYKV